MAWLGLCHDTTDCIMTGGLAWLGNWVATQKVYRDLRGGWPAGGVLRHG